MLLMVPEPITFELRSEVTANLRNVRLDRLAEVGDLGDPQQSLALRAKQPSAGGRMVVYSSKSGTQRVVNPRQHPNPAVGRQVQPSSENGIPAERLD